MRRCLLHTSYNNTLVPLWLSQLWFFTTGGRLQYTETEQQAEQQYQKGCNQLGPQHVSL